MDEVSIICKRTVVSTKSVTPGKTYSFSTLDCIMESHHLRVVYYYSSLPHKVPGELTRKLRESLSETLSCFPVVTGRLIKSDEGRWMIKCNDAGVRIVEARVKGSVEEWLHGVDREKELQLVHWEEMYHEPHFWCTFYIQLSEFQGGGFAIGLSCTHLLADPICATMFIKAWADTNLGGKMLGPPFFHSLPPRRPGNRNINHKPYTQLINYYKSSIYRETPAPVKALNYVTTVTLAFTDTMVRACMGMAGQAMDPSDGQLLSGSSPFAALAGLFWICLSRIKNMSEEWLVDMAICLDMRKVLGLDRGFFGNCVVSNKVHGQGFDRNSLSKAAGAIGDVVGKMDPEGVMDLIEWLDDGNVHHKNAPPDHCDLICIINLEGDEAYSTVFGEGNNKPMHVSYYVEPVCGEGQVLILPWQPKEGPLSRAVMVTLPQDEVLKLLDDSLLLRFSPTIKMGANKLKR